MIETSELGGRLALVDPKSLETEQRSLYDFIDQKFVPWSREANFAIKIDGGRYVGPFNTFLYTPKVGKAFLEFMEAETQFSTLNARVREVVILNLWCILECEVRTLCPLSASSQSWPFGTVHPSSSHWAATGGTKR